MTTQNYPAASRKFGVCPDDHKRDKVLTTQLFAGNLRLKMLFTAIYLGAMVFAFVALPVRASDHLDTPTVIADPAADIGDLFAWTSSDGRRLNLVMTIVAHQFSDRIQYVFHVDSGARFGKTTRSTTIICQFDAAGTVECWAGEADHLHGDAGKTTGLDGEKQRFRVFAGLRDDPFFNNVKGTRAALNVAAAALKNGAKSDAAGCVQFDEATSAAIFDRWRHTEGGPPKNLLAGWKSAALVASVDLGIVSAGGKQLAVWASTYRQLQKSDSQNRTPPALGSPVDRIGRALTANMLIDPLGPDEVSDARKETYNRSGLADWSQFTADIERTLGLFDAYDRSCGNQWLADQKAAPSKRYHALAKMLADDRLWINSRSADCSQYLAVEFAGLTKKSSLTGDCGGRTPLYNANAVFRSLLVRGTPDGVDDGLDHDDGSPSTTVFPFLAALTGPAETQEKYGLTTTEKQNNAFNDAYVTTTGSIAITNLDHLIVQRPDEAGAEDLLLARSRYLGDYGALDRALTSAETRASSGRELLRRAAARSAVHRFAGALDDLAAAELAGADPARVEDIRASILVATGCAAEVVPKLEAALARRPTFAARSSLANAYAAVGRFTDADRLYEAALASLDTTSPFPYAWIYFARGLMWSEQAGDKARGKEMYMHALEHLPEFAAANIHLAELEIARGELPSAISRLERVVALSDEPEALALLGDLRVRTGDLTGGQTLITRAGKIYDALLARHLLAFADHAAEFYLGPGRDPERAWHLASRNLANRETRASFALAIKAARAAGRLSEAEILAAKAQIRFGKKVG